MKINKIRSMHPFDMSQKPAKQNPFLLPLIWGGSYLLTRQHKLKIEKKSMAGIKPPYLVIATHQGPADYYIGPLAMFPHRAMYVSDMEGFANFGKWLYRGLGCIAKRRYVHDVSVIRNIKYAIEQGQSVVIFPESRHSNVGTTAYIPKQMGKLAKLLNVPVVTLAAKGSYLANPFWDEGRTRKVPIRATMECIYTKEALTKVTHDEIQRKIEEQLTYDEYAYQHDSDIKITAEYRAEGLHKPLYQCIKCGTLYEMQTKGAMLTCAHCGAKWLLTADGWLLALETDAAGVAHKYHIPDWYEWQRKMLIAQMENLRKTDKTAYTNYKEQYKVRVFALPNEHGFIDFGEAKLTLTTKAFMLDYRDENQNIARLTFPHHIRESVQTEYNYQNHGPCIVLSTKDCCYYLYSSDPKFSPTRLQLMGEYLFSL